MKPIAFTAISCWFAAALGGCSSLPPQRAPATVSLKDATSIVPYVLQPLDRIDVVFLTEKDYDSSLQIGPDGLIYLPTGSAPIHAAGKTPGELAPIIAEAYAPWIRRPVLTVQVSEYANLRTFVGGEVGLPGPVELGANMTVLSAIVAAGGFKPTARLDKVVVIRRSPPRTEAFTVNLIKAISGEQSSNDVVLEAADIVIVPPTKVANFDRWIDEYIRLALPFTMSSNATYNYGTLHSAPIP
jgi:protein involved in polysaccharide export with SLBB domain